MKNKWEDKVRKILFQLSRWWWLIVVFALLCAAAAYVYTGTLTPIYQASATVEIQDPEESGVSTKAAQILNPEEYLSTQLFRMKSSGLIEQVIESENLHAHSELSAQAGILAGEPLSLRTAKLVEFLRAGLDVTYLGDSRILRVRFTNESPELAALIPNRLVQTFEDNIVVADQAVVESEQEALEGRLQSVKSRLEDSERILSDFVKQTDLQNLPATGFEFDPSDTEEARRLQRLTDEKETLLREVEDTKRRVDALSKGQASPILLDDPEIKKVIEIKRAYERKYEEDLLIFKEDYPDMVELRIKIKQADEDVDLIYEQKLKSTQFTLDSLEDQLSSVESRIQMSTRELNVIRAASVDYNRLRLDVETNRAEYNGLLERVKTDAAEQAPIIPAVNILDLAQKPTKPIYPNLELNMLWAALGSSFLSFLTIVFISILDDRISSPDSVIDRLGMRLLGVIPKMKTKDMTNELLSNPLSPTAEAYSTARTKLDNILANYTHTPCVQVTSTRAGEGKSVTSLALSRSFAVIGKKTLMIDADLRLPSFQNKDSSSIGLAGLLENGGNVENEIQSTRIVNLDFLEAGIEPDDPARLLASQELKDILARVRELYDVVIVDGPPVLGLSDALLLGGVCDETVIVTQSNTLPARAVITTIQSLKPACRHIAGLVMTKYRPSHGRHSYHYSRYSYGKQATQYGKNSQGRFRNKPKKRVHLGQE
jgi:capsular exopolysaccharide synthesis family protein